MTLSMFVFSGRICRKLVESYCSRAPARPPLIYYLWVGLLSRGERGGCWRVSAHAVLEARARKLRRVVAQAEAVEVTPDPRIRAVGEPVCQHGLGAQAAAGVRLFVRHVDVEKGAGVRTGIVYGAAVSVVEELTRAVRLPRRD